MQGSFLQQQRQQQQQQQPHQEKIRTRTYTSTAPLFEQPVNMCFRGNHPPFPHRIPQHCDGNPAEGV